jgi:DNA-damage-inducible protein D
MNIIAFSPMQANPFDQIKQIDVDWFGYWLATELLILIGYQSWRQIQDTVERAKISARNIGLDESHHLTTVVLVEQMKQRQQNELQPLVGDLLETTKRELLTRFWAQEAEQ